MDIMEYNVELETCNKCKKICYCIKHPDALVFLCENCFLWSIGNAQVKDQIAKIYREFGMEDIESYRMEVA